jgi:hypothetical protein
MRTPRLGLSRVVKMFALFFVVFALLQAAVYYVSKILFPAQIMVDSRGWVCQTSFLVFLEVIVAAVCAAVLSVMYVQHIIGPLQRLTEEMKTMEITGEFRQIKLREGDKLLGLAEVINSIMTNIFRK